MLANRGSIQEAPERARVPLRSFGSGPICYRTGTENSDLPFGFVRKSLASLRARLAFPLGGRGVFQAETAEAGIFGALVQNPPRQNDRFEGVPSHRMCSQHNLKMAERSITATCLLKPRR